MGIGNPGSDYANNRRNVGFWVANRLARRHGIDFNTKTASYLLAEGEIEMSVLNIRNSQIGSLN